MCIFHRWETLYYQNKEKFFGEFCTDYETTGYRKCKKCNKIQLYKRAGFTSGYYTTLNECRQKIIMKNIERIDGVLVLRKYKPNFTPPPMANIIVNKNAKPPTKE